MNLRHHETRANASIDRSDSAFLQPVFLQFGLAQAKLPVITRYVTARWFKSTTDFLVRRIPH